MHPLDPGTQVLVVWFDSAQYDWWQDIETARKSTVVEVYSLGFVVEHDIKNQTLSICRSENKDNDLVEGVLVVPLQAVIGLHLVEETQNLLEEYRKETP